VFVEELPRLTGTFRAGVEAQRAQARSAENLLTDVAARLSLIAEPAAIRREGPLRCGDPATSAGPLTQPREQR
jgi:hypothetical protein